MHLHAHRRNRCGQRAAHRAGRAAISGDLDPSRGGNFRRAAEEIAEGGAVRPGAVAAQVVRVRADGSQSTQNVARFDESLKLFVPAPVDLSDPTDKLYLVLYGTGLRYAPGNTSATSVTIGGQTLPVLFSGAQPLFTGLDQINVGPLPASLKGAGTVDVRVIVNGQLANTVSLTLQ